MDEENIIDGKKDVEGQNGGNDSAQNGLKPDEAFYAKLDGILEKRLSGVAKSVLKDNGVPENEIGDTFSNYKAYKDSKRNTANEEISRIKNENEILKKEMFDNRLKTVTAKVAAELEIDPKKIDYVSKLADFSKATKDNKIDEAELKSALEDVLKDIPEFKTKKDSEGNIGFKKIGAGNDNGDETSDAINKLRAAFKLKTEQK